MDALNLHALVPQVQAWVSQHAWPLGLGAGALTLFALASGRSSRMRRPLPTGWGAGRWATVHDMRQAGMFRREGIVVGYAAGTHLRATAQQHTLFVGPSGSGKSVLLLKTLRRYAESAIVIDLKGTLRDETEAIRTRLGPVYTFDPVHGGDHLNPWDLIRWGTGQEVVDIQRVVSHLTYTSVETRSDAGLYYLAEAQEALWAFFPYLYYSTVAEASMGGLRQWMSVSGRAIRQRIQDMVKFTASSPHTLVRDWAVAMVGKPITLLDKIWSAAKRWLMHWADPALAWNTHDTTIDLQAFQQSPQPATLYLRVSIEDIQLRLRGLVRMFLDMISLRLCDRQEDAYQHEVLWVLDELPQLHYLAMVDRLHAYMRGFGHRLLGTAQAFGQLGRWYGTATAILNNLRTVVMFRPEDTDERETISAGLGDTTVIEPDDRMTHGSHGGSHSVGVRSHRRRLMTPEELRELSDAQAIVCVGGYPPMLVERGPMQEAA